MYVNGVLLCLWNVNMHFYFRSGLWSSKRGVCFHIFHVYSAYDGERLMYAVKHTLVCVLPFVFMVYECNHN